MNKEKFLEELRGHLAVLEEQEQQDILEEYAQHIEFKMKNGQSEEDAIRDFGPMKELAAEILEAYHVRPDFGEDRQKRKLPDLSGAAAAGEKGLRRTGAFFQRGAQALSRGIRKMGEGICRGARGFFLWLKCPFVKNKTEAPSSEEALAAGKLPSGEKARSGAFKKALGAFLVRVGALARWCLRLLWNLFWLFLTAGTGALTLAVLFGFGLLLVLTLQSYPLKGAALLGLGLLLGCGSAACLSFGFIRMKKEPGGVRTRLARRILLGVFCAGALLGGLGTGIAFAEFSSLTYGGQMILGAEREETLEQELAIDPEAGVWKIQSYMLDECAELIVDESVPENTVRVRFTYNGARVTPEALAEIYEEEYWNGSSYEMRETPFINFYWIDSDMDEVKLFMEAKDLLLSGLKEGKLVSFQAPAYVYGIEVLVNPVNEKDVRIS